MPSPSQPLAPDQEYLAAITTKCRAVARDAVVRCVALEFLAQRLVLLRDRVVPMRPTPREIIPTARVNRLAAVFRFKIQVPFRERAQK